MSNTTGRGRTDEIASGLALEVKHRGAFEDAERSPDCLYVEDPYASSEDGKEYCGGRLVPQQPERQDQSRR
jgi:hypothetical protein